MALKEKQSNGNSAKLMHWQKNKNVRFAGLAAATVLILIISWFMGYVGSNSPITGDLARLQCSEPVKAVQDWHIRAFRPQWFRLFGSPGPITYRTSGRKHHRVSIVDLDRRDVEIGVWIDDKNMGYRPVDLNTPFDCGEDLKTCLDNSFAAATVIVPPGRHTVKAEIIDPHGTFQWGGERKRRVKWMVEECGN